MDLFSKFESDIQSYEDMHKEVEMLRQEMYDQTIIYIRNEIGSVQGLSEIQIYMNFKLVLMNLLVSLRL